LRNKEKNNFQNFNFSKKNSKWFVFFCLFYFRILFGVQKASKTFFKDFCRSKNNGDRAKKPNARFVKFEIRAYGVSREPGEISQIYLANIFFL